MQPPSSKLLNHKDLVRQQGGVHPNLVIRTRNAVIMEAHSLSKYLLSIYYVPDTVLDPRSRQRIRHEKALPSGNWHSGRSYDGWKHKREIIHDQDYFR